MQKVLIHASELITGSGVRTKDGRKVTDRDLNRIPDGAIVYDVKKLGKIEVPGKVKWVGATSDLPKQYAKLRAIHLKNKQAIIPGLVDCHTHLVFSGDRSDEFARRCAGATYEEIAAQGGGILSTVKATREAKLEELEELAAERVEEATRFGVRTLEIKSGYGLDLENELKQLEVIKRLKNRFPQFTLTSTFLGAHAFPKERKRDEYLKDLEEILQVVAKKKLADSCDIFVDQGYFTKEEARSHLGLAKRLGLNIKIHADELVNTESAALAVKLKALSADHLLKISEEGASRISHSDTVAVLLPGTAFYLKADYAPARKLIDQGACVALSTDFNPGTCMSLSLPSIMTIAALYLKMSRAEIFAAVTYNGAKALGLSSRKGTLEPGMDADIAVIPFERFEDMYYRFAWLPRTSR